MGRTRRTGLVRFERVGGGGAGNSYAVTSFATDQDKQPMRFKKAA